MVQPSPACPSCGAEVQSDCVVCPHCAGTLGESAVPPPPEAVGVPPPPAAGLLALEKPAATAPLTPPPAPPPPSRRRRHVLHAATRRERRPLSPDLETLSDLSNFFPPGTITLDLAGIAARASAAPVPGDWPATFRAALAAEPPLATRDPEVTAQLATMLASLLRMQAQTRLLEPTQILREWAQGGGRLTLTVERPAPAAPPPDSRSPPTRTPLPLAPASISAASLSVTCPASLPPCLAGPAAPSPPPPSSWPSPSWSSLPVSRADSPLSTSDFPANCMSRWHWRLAGARPHEGALAAARDWRVALVPG